MSSEFKEGAKNLVSVSATSTPVIGTRKKVAEAAWASKDSEKSKSEYRENLTQILCTRYPITFWKKFVPVLVLLDSSSKVNTIHLTFAQKLELPIRLMDVRIQKIDSTTLDTFRMVVAVCLVTDKANRIRFFEETCLVDNISPEVVFGMPFLTLSGADIDFLG